MIFRDDLKQSIISMIIYNWYFRNSIIHGATVTWFEVAKLGWDPIAMAGPVYPNSKAKIHGRKKCSASKQHIFFNSGFFELSICRGVPAGAHAPALATLTPTAQLRMKARHLFFWNAQEETIFVLLLSGLNHRLLTKVIYRCVWRCTCQISMGKKLRTVDSQR